MLLQCPYILFIVVGVYIVLKFKMMLSCNWVYLHVNLGCVGKWVHTRHF